MYPVSSEILVLLNQSYKVLGRLRASVNGSPFTYPVKMQDASVSVSGSSPIRRTLTATIQAQIDDAECDVFRTEMRAEYGLEDIAGNQYWVPVGTFVITDAEEASPGVMSIKGEDRWRRVVNARFLQPTVTSGSHITAIKTLVTGSDGRITCDDYTLSTATHTQSLWDRDRDKAIIQLATALGAQVSFNPMGVAEIRYAASLGDPLAWIVAGGDGGVLINAKRGKNQSITYNAAVAEGENSDGTAPIRAIVKVIDPSSPLLYGGSFASRPRYFKSSLITSNPQALQTATSMLARVTGVARTGSLDTLPHPGLDSGDLLRIEVQPGVWEDHLVDSFTLPLGPGSVSITSRTNPDAAGE